MSSSSAWRGFRELHIDGVNGDWLLIYKIEPKDLILTLVKTGSHKSLLGK
ncbi:type II toxin-antitoxin system mRNA interferase toxin, RelE/StbE family [Lacticaseibacillus rhamnosus]|nr:type II toxin-antitoxin system mRNA interferase toxin, RelE/StbE family [Lacticaseibacillus rhamnosus]MCT3173613.1 type II toxin-antitoxin system mRNA interferase toxin, RelE/StbE family [Lacticaseibacillus rhamnosus]MCT3180938.1 type II toxin-antitoxin system mRNA interferase toxin, RelE/StbE family [Lacticaseibacillus rhamnosus]WHM89378.1 type II toxin-antitoxin system mRNA interferase toxin, RelE/StbE family [Lacticaseibacillus rhamnosus]